MQVRNGHNVIIAVTLQMENNQQKKTFKKQLGLLVELFRLLLCVKLAPIIER